MEINYKIADENDAYGISYVSAHSWNETYKGLLPDDYLESRIKSIPDKFAYIWEIITDINHLRMGVAANILKYIKTKYEGYTIYSCIELSNIPSFRLHLNMGFKTIYEFKGKDNSEYAMMELNLNK